MTRRGLGPKSDPDAVCVLLGRHLLGVLRADPARLGVVRSGQVDPFVTLLTDHRP